MRVEILMDQFCPQVKLYFQLKDVFRLHSGFIGSLLTAFCYCNSYFLLLFIVWQIKDGDVDGPAGPLNL